VTEVECLVFDLNKSERLFLSDIFKPESDYLNKISGLAYDYLIKSSDKDFVKTGTAPEAENFSNFILSQDKIIFYFSPCIVDACSAGSKHVPIKLSDLSMFLSERFYAGAEEEKKGLTISGLKEGDIIKSPLEITGKINRDSWVCFEGVAGRVDIIDENSNVVATGEMKATSDCLKESVEFNINIEFKIPTAKEGFVVFYNENPSGLEENNRQQIIKIRFK
jgi:hypothetical protein